MSSRLSDWRRIRAAGVLLVAAVFLLGLAAAPASADSGKRVVKVMTYNMDAGTDFVYFLAPGYDQETAYYATVAELEASDFAGRAGLLADKIGAEQPDLVSLQEVTVWDYVTDTGAQVGLIANQLDLLTAALSARHLPYTVVVTQPLTDLYLPVGGGVNFHFLDRNVILARADLAGAGMALSNVQTGIYAATIDPLPGFHQVNGWMSVDVTFRERTVRFFGTHLESPLSADDPTQMYQGLELIQIMNQSPYPVALAGDFNSDLSGLGIGPDLTPTASWIVAAGYADSWTVRHTGDDGLTWPLFGEDIFVGRPGPTERIDLIFAKGLRALNAKTVGADAPFPSDHAGVVATLLIDKQK
jgi:endonuclease/exonuclease/phosphatase family metal-dependent hydrolase